ncbi:MAG TPA: PQQ-dependent sugar dehydrogenase [Caulobacteraceae bacterium]|jgi:glucose/arabinose dehydrogenase|nr:PQQ-dependent sugar dehydrogenase [Caulobacteraceae bacterium]
MAVRGVWIGVSAATLASVGLAAHGQQVRTGTAAMGDWQADAPGVVRHLTATDEPTPSTPSALPASVVARPAGAHPSVPAGFSVQPFAQVKGARQIRVAPNGDVFVAQTNSGSVTVLRATDGASTPSEQSVFVSGLVLPFGIAFYPEGPNPQWVYVAENNRVVRYPYQNGDLKARGAGEVVVAKLSPPGGGHVTRDVDFSKDGRTMFVSVGSGSNVSEEMPGKTLDEAKAYDAEHHALGATWGPEENRADLLRFDPDGKNFAIYATGLRNCVSVRVEPRTGTPWCVVNERDSLGDNLPFDYATTVKAGGYYGWPWWYIGDHEDKRPKNLRPDLAGKAIVPDVLFQAHSAPLGLAFYTARRGVAAFPAEYEGDAFITLHGSWNRAKRTGYKLVRVKVKNGEPTGTYEDFLTGFVVDDKSVWGRPVGVAVAHDGALLVSDDGGGVIWRITPDKGSK